ncbi:MAG: hypothetical protein QHH09_02835 [Microgenomates group bacterium]|nr:hypothetical protein [Microgenomates group bacterium]
MEEEILEVVRYFFRFDYPPMAEEIYTFLPKRLKKKAFTSILEKLVKKGLIKSQKLRLNCSENYKPKIKNYPRYTPGEYKKREKERKIKTNHDGRANKLLIKNSHSAIYQVDNFQKRFSQSQKKLHRLRFKLYLKLISVFPQIKLVGLSGSLSMMNAKENDDIDLFIITANNRLFTGRFIALALAEFLRIRRAREERSSSSAGEENWWSKESRFLSGVEKQEAGKCGSRQGQTADDNHIQGMTTGKNKDKICLNLFFDEARLAVPEFKQTEFVGHEILQMKPLVVKDDIYQRFLAANNWVFRLFPNAKLRIANSKLLLSNQFQIFKKKPPKPNKNLNSKIKKIGDWVEKKLKNWQLGMINKHKTTEIISKHQLWFHPVDFGKKLIE